MIQNNFLVTGKYYSTPTDTFREFLNIRQENTKKQNPDLMVIMMNPGSSKPINEDDNGQIETPAVPDKTQQQIISVMQRCDFQYARILNLSDLREPKSADFIRKISQLENEKIPHSIFDSARKNDLDKLFVGNIPLILAWGVNPKLLPLAMNVNPLLQTSSIVLGKLKENTDFSFYHPLPRSIAQQNAWIEEICTQYHQSLS